jgi:RimJ/RimL family protein N-acetyltransferase
VSDVTLRGAEPDDADFLLELLTDEATRPFLGGRTPSTHEAVLAELERTVVFEHDGERIGSATYRVANERNSIVEAGRFAIHPRFRGRGLGDAAARALQRHLLLERGFHRVELQVYGFNERAIAHAERVGYVREGVKRKAYERHGEWQDAVLFSLLREDLEE